MTLDLTEEETTALLRELDSIIASDRYFLSPRITTLNAIRTKIRQRRYASDWRLCRTTSPLARMRQDDGAPGADV